MEIVSVKCEKREQLGSKFAKSTRREGKIPCVLYGGKEEIHFTTTINEVKTLIYTPDFKLANVEIDGATHKCIIKDVQFHPITDDIDHIDFLRVIDGVPIKVEVPVRFIGSSPGVKLGGKLQQSIRKIKVKTLPENMVDHLVLDVSELDLGQSIRVRDIQPVEGIEIMNAPAIPVAIVEIPRALRSAASAAEKEG